MEVQERTIRIYEETITVGAWKSGKTAWTASADFQGKPIQVKARSANQAFDHWKSRAMSYLFD